MLSEDKYFQGLTEAELWQRYCGFLDLSIDEFTDIQEELLMDQLDRVADSILGKKIMGERKPTSVEEFRQMVPLTTYDDYEPYLSERREDVLAEKPYLWCHSSGRGGYFKWIPYTSEFIQKTTVRALTTVILASCTKKGQVNISPGMNFLLVVPPAPYVSGTMFQSFSEHFSFRAIPPPEMVKNMEFQEKIQKGFQIALEEGVDLTAAIASVLVRVGEQFSEQARGMKFSKSMLHPRIAYRLLQAWLHAKKEKRAILPKDLWPTKAILTAGVDIAIYKDDIAHYWGVEPYEFYMCTEVSLIATQIWTRKGMVFVPDLEFLEFIPYDKQLEHQDDSNYQPSTVLLSEVEEGKLYEVVVTQFYGMPLLRYRLKDIVKIIALRDDETGVNLPQMVFQRKVGETINLASLANLDEKTIWRAIANTGIKYTDWSACKEYDRNQSFLRLYLELRERRKAAEIETLIDEQLKVVDEDYKDINAYLGLQPIRVTLLAPGTFQQYMEEKRREGADLAHLKPTHINPPEEVTRRLLQLSEANTGKC
jgi:hypothetical protein